MRINNDVTRVIMIILCMILISLHSITGMNRKMNETAPAKPAIRISPEPGQTFSYTISWNIIKGQKAETWELYEDDGRGFRLIHGPVKMMMNTDIQSMKYHINKADGGIYKYRIRLVNETGETWSEEVTKIIG